MAPETVRELSEALVELQRPIRVLNSVAWTDDVAAAFFAADAGRQPEVDHDYYRRERPLDFATDDLHAAFAALAARVDNELGSSSVADLLRGRISEYRTILAMLDARGTERFHDLSAQLYGASADVLHPGGPTLASLREVMNDALGNIADGDWEPPVERRYTAAEGVDLLQTRLEPVFGDDGVQVRLDDGIVADAAAGSDYIKLRDGAAFTERDLRVLEVHEGWVHVGTSLNGRSQPWCTFLGKGTPSTTSTQEGLAVFTEITTMSSTPSRLRKVTRRMLAIGMVEDGATFLDVYRWFVDGGMDQDDAWSSSVRVFRGSTPTGGPFTKDLVYSRGFLEVYDFIRLAVRRGLLDRLPLLFAGKLAIGELGAIAELVDQDLVAAPQFLPPHIADVRSLASWMAYSNLLNRIDLDAMERHLGSALG